MKIPDKLFLGLGSIVFFGIAIYESMQTIHWGNTEVIRTHHGNEGVGDYVQLPGTNWGTVVLFIVLGLIFLYGVFKKKDEKK